MFGDVAFLIDSNSKLAISDVIKSFKKKHIMIAANSIQLKILPEPKFKYEIRLKQTIKADTLTSFGQTTVRQQLKQKINCNHIIFTNDTIEIWSNVKVDLAELKNETNLKLNKAGIYGDGIKSVIPLN